MEWVLGIVLATLPMWVRVPMVVKMGVTAYCRFAMPRVGAALVVVGAFVYGLNTEKVRRGAQTCQISPWVPLVLLWVALAIEAMLEIEAIVERQNEKTVS